MWGRLAITCFLVHSPPPASLHNHGRLGLEGSAHRSKGRKLRQDAPSLHNRFWIESVLLIAMRGWGHQNQERATDAAGYMPMRGGRSALSTANGLLIWLPQP